MKSNIPHIDHPPRSAARPAGTERWRVFRHEFAGGEQDTVIWFDKRHWRDKDGNAVRPADVVIARGLTDEELDLLRLAFARYGAFSATDVDTYLTGEKRAELEQARLTFARDNAPAEWRAAVGVA